MADIKRTKRIRAGHRAHTKKVLANASGLLETFEGEANQQDQVRKFCITLEEKLATLKDLDAAIVLAVDEDAIEKEIEEAESFKETMHEVLVKLKSLSVEGRRDSQQGGSEVSHSHDSFETGSSPKLPKLALAKFNGDPKRWLEWWDSFSVAVHDNKKIAAVEKFTYLKSLVEGSAAMAISGLPLTGANYNDALEILRERFAQKQVIINSYMQELLKIKPVRSMSEVGRVREIVDKTEVQVRGLKALGVDSYQYGTLLIPIFMEKLPDELKLIVSRKHTDNWELDTIMDAVKAEVQARERCAIGTTAPPSQRVGQESGFAPERKPDQKSTASALLSGNAPNCLFCKEDHRASACKNVKDLVERKAILKKQGRCFVCLSRGGHIARNCTSRVQCLGCKGRHHLAVCDKDNARPVNEGDLPSSAMHINSGTHVFLQTAEVTASRPDHAGQGIKIRVIFDTGAQRSYISQRVANMLKLETIRTDKLTIATFGNEKREVQAVNLVEMTLGKPEMGFKANINAYAVPQICSELQGQDIQWVKQTYPHLRDLDFADSCPGSGAMQIDLLIGSDYLWSFFDGKTIRGEAGGPVAVSTKVGWVLSGPTTNLPKERLSSIQFSSTHVLRVGASVSEETDRDLHRLWDFDSVGIREKESVHESFERGVRMEDGRYSVQLPWKEHHKLLPDNYENSVVRLDSQLRRLGKDPGTLAEYDAVIQEQLKLGIIERVDPTKTTEAGRVHYLPHHAVVRKEAETTKLRVVFDASAKANPESPSLNECLHAGPALAPVIFDILLRFRERKIALVGDIEKAFLNIGVQETDRDVLRFLWVDSVTEEDPALVAYRFARVVFGVNASPFLLNATLRHHIKKYDSDPTFVRNLLHSFYVDDLVSGDSDLPKAFELYQKSKACLREGGFNLRKWRSNSHELVTMIHEEPTESRSEPHCNANGIVEDTESYAKTSIGQTHEPDTKTEHKVLGLSWNCASDDIIFKLGAMYEYAKDLPLTKRNLLKIVSKFYDPLGILSPIVLQMKALFQEVCVEGSDWNELLQEKFQKTWRRWLLELQECHEITIYRSLYKEIEEEVVSYHLHGFGDASKTAYCTVVYLVLQTSSGQYSRLLESKTRVAPLKRQTIPRLELLSGLILARLLSTVREALGSQVLINTVHLWLDSSAAVYWIKGDREWKQFVQNRVNEILSLTDKEMWNHCAGTENPADLGSRGESACKLKTNDLWWKGPPWLSKPETLWSRNQDSSNEEPPQECFEELKKSTTSDQTDEVAFLTISDEIDLCAVVKLADFSSCERLFRITALVLRFIQNLKIKIGMSEAEPIHEPEVTEGELKRAEAQWIRSVQKGMKLEANYPQLVREFGLFEDDVGIVRCKGRIGNAELPHETRFPALLPKDSYLSTLLIRRSHARVHHTKVSTTLAEIRTQYWIVKGRQAVKKIISRCTVCRRFEGNRYRTPPPADLPAFRLSHQPAFSHVGVDFAGPLYVKSHNTSAMEKVYIALFTCCSSRAIHMELVRDLSTGTFIRCLRRFSSRRGVPECVVSDNAKTFKKTSKILKRIFTHPSVKRFCGSRRIAWKFNMDRAPWWGGFFERMVQSAKRCLRKTLGSARLDHDELHTVVVEVEATINSRPLTYVSSDELEEPLTPSHLICGRRLHSLPDARPESDLYSTGVSADELSRRGKHILLVLDHFWKRWRKEYVAELRNQHRVRVQRDNHTSIAVGDIVVVHEDNQPRGQWRLGRIDNLIPSADDKVRAAVVRVVTKSGRPVLMKRPVQRLFPLEVSRGAEHEQPDQAAEETGRPRRAAALNADFLRRLNQ